MGRASGSPLASDGRARAASSTALIHGHGGGFAPNPTPRSFLKLPNNDMATMTMAPLAIAALSVAAIALPSLLRPPSSPHLFASALALPPAATPPKIYASASSVPSPPLTSDPFAPTPLDDFLLSAFRWTLQRRSGVAVPSAPGFEGMMAELHELRRTKGAEELERVSLSTMTALAGPIPWTYRTFFAEWEASPALLAWSAKFLLPFLVGDMTLTTRVAEGSGETNIDDGFFGRGGGLLVEKCRVLEGSNCKGICTKMCKVPTQRFFKERWGVPLSMEPNFETGACQLRFGVEAMDLEDDPTIPRGCLGRCPASIAAELNGVDGDVGLC
ncbi:hypothetical protein ACHAWF_014604 [Thalassiosira exigua]